MQRRTLLGMGIAGSAVLAVAGGGAWLLRASRAWRDGRLLPDGQRVLRAVARGVLDGSLPDGVRAPGAQAAALDAHLVRMQASLAALSPAAQREVDELLTLLATAPGRVALATLAPAWEDASVHDIQQALQSMRFSSIALRRQAYQALRDLTHVAFFADPSTWARLGYPGPLRIS
ncbi:MAG TPA: hypothetical protein VFQ20_01505 [Burkholderiaceae bacterium]|nr:hypothetical protein [Burkholderiaceae bacterium]